MAATRHTPQVDLTTVNAVQSMFTPGPPDPWSATLAADFVDLILWNDEVRVPVAILADATVHEDKMFPSMLEQLRRRDPGWLSPDLRVLPEPRHLLPSLLDPALREFGAFAVNNAGYIRRFLDIHDAPWIHDQIQSRAGSAGHYVFDVAELASRPGAQLLAARLQVPDNRVYYLLDLVLKYLVYAEHADEDYYLSHPIRAKQRFHYLQPVVDRNRDKLSNCIPFRLGPYLVQAARTRNQDWFTSTLHEARGYLRREGMTELTEAGSVSRDALRELAARLQLPAKVRKYELGGRTATLISASGGLAGSLVSTNLWPAVVGSAMTVATTIWSGNVPTSASRLRWLRWMLQWPLEDEAETS